jgi:hypothetical protein
MWGKNIETALAVARPQQIERRPREPEIIDLEPIGQRSVIDQPACHLPSDVIPYGEGNVPIIRDQVELPRMCASRRMPYIVRYILAGRWEYSCSVRLDPQTRHELYGGRVHERIQLSTDDLGYETCAWCGATGKGGIWCNRCGAVACHGTKYRRGNETWARCACGRECAICERSYTETAIFPKVKAR